MTIPIVLITDDNFVMQTCVAITSLVNNKQPHTDYQIFVVMAECGSEARERLKRLPNVTQIEASMNEYHEIRQLEHIPIACLLKFNICELLTDYDRILYLDGDVIVREDLSPLYEIDVSDYYAAAVQQIYSIQDESRRMNAGIILFNAKKMRDDDMLPKLIEMRKSLGDRRSMDQQTFNMLIGDQIRFIHPRYNCVPVQTEEAVKKWRMEAVNRFFSTDYRSSEEMIADAAIIHYASEFKPWKYTHVPCGEEWYQYYLKSPYARIPLKRFGKWEARAKRIRDAYSADGVLGVLRICNEAIRKKMYADKATQNWG